MGKTVAKPESGGTFWLFKASDYLGADVDDDAQLIAETRAGNSAAFGQLVAKYQDRLFNAMIHIVGSREDARDVVQDAFVQAFTKLGSFQQQAAFYTWLYRITFNLAITKRRRRKPTQSLDQNHLDTGDDPIAVGSDPTEPMELQERATQVRAALATLSEEFRTVLVLREMDGCDYETIAEMLQLPVGTVRSRLHRARLQIRDQLKFMLQPDLQ